MVMVFDELSDTLCKVADMVCWTLKQLFTGVSSESIRSYSCFMISPVSILIVPDTGTAESYIQVRSQSSGASG